jgi:hypothetical protein
MLGVVRVLALFILAGTAAGCQTDGLVGPEAEASAKPRVIDTQKTRSAAAKRETARSGVIAEGDGPVRTAATNFNEVAPNPRSTAAADPALIPAQTLFGNWTLVEDGGGRKCRLILGGVLLGSSYSARAEPDCPDAFVAVQSWEIQGDHLVLRNNERRVVGRLQATGPFRFDGRAESGGPVYLIR